MAQEFKSGEIVISSGYPDTAKALQAEGVNAKFAVAKEGQFLWACGYGITPNIDPANLDADLRTHAANLDHRCFSPVACAAQSTPQPGG